jgi:hypothetical protein
MYLAVELLLLPARYCFDYRFDELVVIPVAVPLAEPHGYAGGRMMFGRLPPANLVVATSTGFIRAASWPSLRRRGLGAGATCHDCSR